MHAFHPKSVPTPWSMNTSRALVVAAGSSMVVAVLSMAAEVARWFLSARARAAVRRMAVLRL